MNFKTSQSIIYNYLKSNHKSNFIYHVTSDYYKTSIMKNGLKREFTITKKHIDSLRILIEDDNFSDLNKKLNFGYLGEQLIMDRIEETFKNINADDYPLSFSNTYSDIFNYFKNDTKGGQYLMHIRTLIKQVDERFQKRNNLENIIDDNIFEIMDFIKNLDRSNFLLCIVDKYNLNEFENNDPNRFQTTDDVNVTNIVELIEFN